MSQHNASCKSSAASFKRTLGGPSGAPGTRPRRPSPLRWMSIAPRGLPASCFKELQSLFHERLVVLEDAPMPGILIEDEFGVRKAARQVDRVDAGHHLVVLTIRHQNRVVNTR